MRSKYVVTLEDVFDIVEQIDKKGQRIYRLKFRHNGAFLNKDGMSTSRYTMHSLAYRWIRDNEKKAIDMVFEHNVLLDKVESREGFDPSSLS